MYNYVRPSRPYLKVVVVELAIVEVMVRVRNCSFMLRVLTLKYKGVQEELNFKLVRFRKSVLLALSESFIVRLRDYLLFEV